MNENTDSQNPPFTSVGISVDSALRELHYLFIGSITNIPLCLFFCPGSVLSTNMCMYKYLNSSQIKFFFPFSHFFLSPC